MRHSPAHTPAIAALAVSISLATGCADSTAAGPPAPKTVTAAQVKEMPLEQSGDLSVRQNRADPPRRTVIDRDTHVPNAPSHTPKGRSR